MCARSSQSTKRELLPCVFSSHVSCSVRKSEKFLIMSKCSGCKHYKKFVEEMEREDEEFWNEVDEKNKSLRCHCDGKPCSMGDACFGATSDSGELFVCPRFDVNRLPDSSLIKTEFLRLCGSGSVEC
jgi:hypothetical protein